MDDDPDFSSQPNFFKTIPWMFVKKIVNFNSDFWRESLEFSNTVFLSLGIF